MEESFLRLKAVAGSSQISMTSVALTTDTLAGACPPMAARTSASRPTRAISHSGCFAAAARPP